MIWLRKDIWKLESLKTHVYIIAYLSICRAERVRHYTWINSRIIIYIFKLYYICLLYFFIYVRSFYLYIFTFSIEPSRICGLTLKAVNTSSAHLRWNPTETNFTHYKIYISNRTFAEEYLIWGVMTEHTVTDLTPGGIYNITVYRVRGSVEGSGTFIRVIAGIFTNSFWYLKTSHFTYCAA